MRLHEILGDTEPMVLMLTHGESVAADLSKQLEQAEKDGLKVYKINVDEEPDFAEQFEVGKHPVLVTWHCGEVIGRRNRPWATDASEMIKQIKTLTTPANLPSNGNADETAEIVTDKPVVVTDDTFDAMVIKSEVPVLVDFWAAWCGPCRMVAPILDKMAQEFAGQVRIAKVDVDANPTLSREFQIRSIPTMMFVKGGKVVGLSAGAAPEGAIRDAIKQLIELEV